MQIASSWSTAAGAAAAFDDARRHLNEKLGGEPTLLLLYFTEAYPAAELAREIENLPATTKVHGASTCLGVMTEEGMHGEDGRALAMLGLRDPGDDGCAAGVGAARQGADPRAAARAATEAALADSGRPGELPELVWLNAAPGAEEAILHGIEDIVGAAVPIVGGSAADNAVAGRWSLLTRTLCADDAVVVTVFFPSCRTACAFQSGYLPTPHLGYVTGATGRIVHTIDRRPAGEVYREWTGGLLAAIPPEGGSILAQTTLAPLGRVAGTVGGVPYYTLAHPDALLPDGSLRLFAEVAPGDELTLMSGSPDSLVARAGRVAADAVKFGGFAPGQVLGGLVVYCAGCMLTVQARMPEVVAGIVAAFGGRPFVGLFTFGEQGCLTEGQAAHGNLMISSLVFGE